MFTAYSISAAAEAGLAETALPNGYWPLEKSKAILEKTATTRLAPDLSSLAPAEVSAVNDLLKVGQIMQDLYEESRHPQALSSRRRLRTLHETGGKSAATANLMELYRLSQGPIVATLDNKRVAFLPVDEQQPGKNVYPWKITKEEIEAFLAKHPDQRESLLAERSVVRRATAANLDRDLAALAAHPAIAALHARSKQQFTALKKNPDSKVLYPVPYSIAYASQLSRAFTLLNSAAEKLESVDPEFSRYLRNRARDFLSNDYESGDASWVTGRFKRFNAQIGAYETYDDALYGAKAFHSFSLLLVNAAATAELNKAIAGLQQIESSLPYKSARRIREDIPVGIYEVVADFGQSRGGNTASILPNDSLFSRRYGRTILLRENIMKHPDIAGNSDRVWKAAMAPDFADHLSSDGEFSRTLWHEVGHYLGVDRANDGRDLAIALEDYADALEEMKADLVSLYAAPALRKSGFYNDDSLRALYAGGIRRTLQNNKPRTDQPYQRMQLVQFNYFLENGLLIHDETNENLRVRYEKYPEVVRGLLEATLKLQDQGDKAAAAAFFERYSGWTPELHDALAEKIRAAQGARFRIFRYGALGE